MRFPSSLRPCATLLALLTTAVSAQSLPTQRVAAVGTATTRGGIDGPFAPQALATTEAPVADSTGSALDDQAQQRLVSSLGANGALAQHQAITKAQAQAHGLGFVATHFEQIDRTHSGHVTLDDVEAFVQQQRQR